jgi:hypothetical protein
MLDSVSDSNSPVGLHYDHTTHFTCLTLRFTSPVQSFDLRSYPIR